MTTSPTHPHLRTIPLAAALLALPVASAYADAPAVDPPSARSAALQTPVAGHLTVAAHMLAAARRVRRQRLLRVAARVRRRDELRAARRLRAFRRVAIPDSLEPIAECESGGDPGAVGGGGLYRGKYQFDRATWASVGGDGDPADAPEVEQDVRAARLYRRAGPAPWPVCGR